MEAFDDCLKTEKQHDRVLKIRKIANAQIYYDSLREDQKFELIIEVSNTIENDIFRKHFMGMSFRAAGMNEILLDYIYANYIKKPCIQY